MEYVDRHRKARKGSGMSDAALVKTSGAMHGPSKPTVKTRGSALKPKCRHKGFANASKKSPGVGSHY